MKEDLLDKYENVVVRKGQKVGINNFGLEYMCKLEQENYILNEIINEVEEMLKDPDNVDCINQNNRFLNRIKELKEEGKK